VKQAGSEGYWTARDPYIRQMEQAVMEVGPNSVRGKMDAFWDAWQELANHPADAAPREAVLTRAQTFVDGVHGQFTMLKNLQNQANEDIVMRVNQVNELSRQIAGLNTDIQRVLAQGDNPNDLLDRRDLLVDKLSSLINITVDRKDPDEFIIHTGGRVLVQGSIGRQFTLNTPPQTAGNPAADNYPFVSWQDTPEQRVQFGAPGDLASGGKLAALIELRDQTLPDQIRRLDAMLMNFDDMVNEVHSQGFGLNGKTGEDFFTELHFTTNANGNVDRNGDGTPDATYIYRMNGVNKLNPSAQIGIEGTLTLNGPDAQDITVAYHADDTVREVLDRVNNSGAEVTARLNRDGQLQFRATAAENRQNPDFVIRHIADNGLFLSGYAGLGTLPNTEGAAGAAPGFDFNWNEANATGVLAQGAAFSTTPLAHPSAWVQVNPALVSDPASIAAGLGQNGHPAPAGNNEAALAIASIRNSRVMVGSVGTFDDWFAEATGQVGMLGEQSGRQLETENEMMKQLHDMRQSVSGVNIDEELANMVKYQHGYAAAARFISTVNSIYDIILNKMV
jgi:flagellar hook-associated protein 1 FlgK